MSCFVHAFCSAGCHLAAALAWSSHHYMVYTAPHSRTGSTTWPREYDSMPPRTAPQEQRPAVALHSTKVAALPPSLALCRGQHLLGAQAAQAGAQAGGKGQVAHRVQRPQVRSPGVQGGVCWRPAIPALLFSSCLAALEPLIRDCRALPAAGLRSSARLSVVPAICLCVSWSARSLRLSPVHRHHAGMHSVGRCWACLRTCAPACSALFERQRQAARRQGQQRTVLGFAEGGLAPQARQLLAELAGLGGRGGGGLRLGVRLAPLAVTAEVPEPAVNGSAEGARIVGVRTGSLMSGRVQRAGCEAHQSWNSHSWEPCSGPCRPCARLIRTSYACWMSMKRSCASWVPPCWSGCVLRAARAQPWGWHEA